MSQVRLVRIDTDTLMYHAYEGKNHLNTVQSDIPLEAGYVEQFRVNTEAVMKTLEDDPEPEAA